MDAATCRDFYLGTFTPTLHPRHALAVEYYRRTEAYDRTVCSGPIRDGSILPGSHHELAVINRRAAAVRRELEARCGDPAGLREAMREVAKMPPCQIHLSPPGWSEATASIATPTAASTPRRPKPW